MSGPRRVIWFVVVVALAALVMFLMPGCLTKGRIKGQGGVVVQGPKDGNNVSLAQEQSTGVLTLPAGSKLTTVKESASPAVPATETTPAIPPKPAREITEVTLSRDTTWRKDETKIAADTGVIDQTVALRRIQVSENRYLLITSIGCMILAGAFFYIKYPTPALMCAAGSVIAFIAWKVADLPPWFWIMVPCLVVGAVFLWRGYERKENEEKDRAAELAKAKAIAVPVVVPVDPPGPT